MSLASTLTRSGALQHRGKARRRLGREAHGALDRVGKLRRMRRGERHDRQRPVGAAGFGRGDRHRGVRIDQLAGGGIGAGDRGARRVVIDPVRGEEPLGFLPQARLGRQVARLAEGAERSRDGSAVARRQLEIEPLEIARDLDVHARAEARLDRGDAHPPGREEAGQDVVAVGADDELGDRHAHAPRHVRGIDVAEIAGRHGEAQGPLGRAQGHGGGHVIDHLGHDPRPVDRIDAGEGEAGAELLVGEHRLHQVLAVVERAVDRDGMNIGRQDRRHLPALDLGNAPVRIEHDDVERVAVAARLDRGRAGVARGRHHHGRALAAPPQHRLEQGADELERIVLEGQGRPVEQLHEPQPGPELLQGRDRPVREAAIGVGHHVAPLVRRHEPVEEGICHGGGELGIREAAERAQRLRVEARPMFGHEQPAVARKSAQQRRLERQTLGRRATVAGRDVGHGSVRGQK